MGALLTITVVFASLFVTGFQAVGVGKSAEEVGILANLPLIAVIAGCLALVVLILAGCAIFWYVRWRWISIVGALVLGGLGCLAYDPSPVPQADLGPRVGTDDLGYQTIMWMAESSPYSRIAETGILNSNAITTFLLPVNGDDWEEFVRKNRELIVRAWNEDKLGRAWIDAINANPPRGVWPQGFNAPIITYKPMRAVCNVRLMPIPLRSTGVAMRRWRFWCR